MEGTITVAQLIEELGNLPPEAIVMIPVVKYPGEFTMRHTEQGWRWDLGTDVEVVPLDLDDITLVDGQCWLTVELMEYNEERATLNGSAAGPG